MYTCSIRWETSGLPWYLQGCDNPLSWKMETLCSQYESWSYRDTHNQWVWTTLPWHRHTWHGMCSVITWAYQFHWLATTSLCAQIPNVWENSRGKVSRETLCSVDMVKGNSSLFTVLFLNRLRHDGVSWARYQTPPMEAVGSILPAVSDAQ